MSKEKKEVVIQVRELTTGYGERPVLDRINLDVYQGEIMVIMGPSGCGKTTLVRNMIGLQKPWEGTILINGRDVNWMEEEEYRSFATDIGVLFQGGALFNSMTLLENVALPLREHTDLPDATVVSIARMKLSLVGLLGAEHLLPSELSGGMKKRAGIARALALDPEILFLDELSAGLDPLIAAGLDDLVRRINRTLGTTMVIVSHELMSIFRIADRIALIRDGKLIAVDTRDEILRHPDPQVSEFVHRKSAKSAKSWLESLLEPTSP